MKLSFGRTALRVSCFAAIMALTALCAGAARSECVLYKGQYGYTAIAHMDGGIIYRGQYGYDAVARMEGTAVYPGKYGGAAAASVKEGLIYRGAYGYEIIGRLDGDIIYKGQYGYDAVAHASCSKDETAALGAAFILGLL